MVLTVELLENVDARGEREGEDVEHDQEDLMIVIHSSSPRADI